MISSQYVGSNGRATFTLPSDNSGPFQPRITTMNALGEQEVFEDSNRVFRISEFV